MSLTAKKVFGALKNITNKLNQKIDDAVTGIYNPAGSCTFENLPELGAAVKGNVYKVTDSFTTTSDFVEGVGHAMPAGTYVAVVNTNTPDSPVYKYDCMEIFGVTGVKGSSEVSYRYGNVSISKTDIGLSAVDNTSDADKPVSTAQQTALGTKADKVVSATEGNFAALDANGNLTDSGKANSDFVHKTGAETIAGTKTFSDPINLSSVYVTGTMPALPEDEDPGPADHPYVLYTGSENGYIPGQIYKAEYNPDNFRWYYRPQIGMLNSNNDFKGTNIFHEAISVGDLQWEDLEPTIYGQGYVNNYQGDPITFNCDIESDGTNITKPCYVKTISSVSSLPVTVSSDDNVVADMVCIKADLSNPNAQTGDWTITTADGSVTIAGTISGSTDVTLYLVRSRSIQI